MQFLEKDPDKNQYTFEDLIAVMRALRDPGNGCPWDIEQDFASIAPYTIEEAYEVADAIARNDMGDLREELGDLLFQPIYHAQMAQEAGAFDIQDVIHSVTHKMISRHPHVFGDENAENAGDVNAIWDVQKKKEKKQGGALDDVPHALPALLRSQKLQKKAAKVGFTWKNIEQAWTKFEEELGELKQALEAGDKAEIAEEFGDVFMTLVNLARMSDVNSEEALRAANHKFEARFAKLEKKVQSDGRAVSELGTEELLRYWDVIK